MERLDKYISEQTGLSRRESRQRIWQGAISVNGAPEKAIDRKIDPQGDRVLMNGLEICYARKLYIMMNKPQGYVSATRDRDERTVLELLAQEHRRGGIAPAGRLDKDTTGLLILTDDGDFIHRMTAPGKEVFKTYIAGLDAPADENTVARFAEGVTLADGTVCRPARLELLGDGTEARISICEGKYHQVKRMCAACGCRVVSLRRVSIGGLALDEALRPGEYRLLTEDECRALLKKDNTGR